jgi:hypothetical protein
LNRSKLVLDHFDRWIFAIWICGFCVKPISVFACYSRIKGTVQRDRSGRN